MDWCSKFCSSSGHKINPPAGWKDHNLSADEPLMPWFGIDIGGTLVKLVYFEPTDERVNSVPEAETTRKIRHYLLSKTAYGDSGVRDVNLQLEDQKINGRIGTLHFIRFPTSNMPGFIALTKSKGLAPNSSTVCATGGGAHKYDSACQISGKAFARKSLSLKFKKMDELHTLISGIQYILKHNSLEAFYYTNPLDNETCKSEFLTSRVDPPYLVVNVGSGVSILAVAEDHSFRRVSGTSLGGGTFHGLCCLLTGCETFEQALELASLGENNKVDKLVGDIYGGDYAPFNLKASTVASSFGNMIHPEKQKQTTKEDLASSALVSITYNIASLSFLCARIEKLKTILFVGNFFRINSISMRHIAHALAYWSENKVKALFMRHEGYFGAVGCLLNLTSADGSDNVEEANLEPSIVDRFRNDVVHSSAVLTPPRYNFFTFNTK
ncbi:Pantothenate kinase 2, mitochondrial [Trichinella spiralis]|uniref:pantothenate kinase n=1 Tax=Trichinella spiralis TaxID=6334 RepID=A0A0V1BM11_TRISP|nr:Pantothenate kinase 2, mitochondrial [Trichinella spiralis]